MSNIILKDSTKAVFEKAVRAALEGIVENRGYIQEEHPELSDGDCQRLVLEIASCVAWTMACEVERPLTDEEQERVSDRVYETQDYDPDVAAEQWLAYATDADYQDVLDGLPDGGEDDAED